MDRASVEGYPLPGRVVMAHLAWIPTEDGAEPEEPVLDVHRDRLPAGQDDASHPELAATPTAVLDGGGGP